MKVFTYLKNEKSLYVIIAILSVFALAPYILATFYIHPNGDDFGFSSELSKLGRIDFISYYYNNWSGRYFAFFLLALPKADIITSPYWYTIIPNVFILLTGVALYKILLLFLFKNLSKWKIFSLTLFFLAFYITGLREVFSALFWNCSSYYLIANVFFLWFIYEFIFFTLHQYKFKSYNFLKLAILAFLVCGLTEIYIISLIVVLSVILIYKFHTTKQLLYSIILLLLIVCLGGYLNIFSPGSLLRMETSKLDGGNSFIYSTFRALYNLIILQLVPLFYSGALLLLLFVLLLGNKVIQFNTKLKSYFNLNPVFTFSLVIFIFYLHHAMSLYGAGYVLQGRVINITDLLLLLALAFVSMNIVVYYNIKPSINTYISLVSILIMAFSINFSKNSRLVGKEALMDFPILDKEMTERYAKINIAKSNGDKIVYIDRISVDLRSLSTDVVYVTGKSYYNSKKICDNLTDFFDIEVRIKNNEYDLLDY